MIVTHRGSSMNFKKGVATIVFATKSRIYPLVTISRREFHNATAGFLIITILLLISPRGFGYNGGPTLDASQDGGNRGAGAAQRAGRSVGRGHRRHPQSVSDHARYVAQTP